MSFRSGVRGGWRFLMQPYTRVRRVGSFLTRFVMARIPPLRMRRDNTFTL